MSGEMGFKVFSKANIARCRRCGFISTEGRMHIVTYSSRGDAMYECKSRRACDRRLQA